MTDIIRDAPLGQIIRYIFRDKVLLYPEEKPDFDFEPYTQPSSTVSSNASGSSTPSDNGQAENAIPLEKIQSTPRRLKDSTILVDWYTANDPDNPQSWTSLKKIFVALQIWYHSTHRELIKSLHFRSLHWVRNLCAKRGWCYGAIRSFRNGCLTWSCPLCARM